MPPGCGCAELLEMEPITPAEEERQKKEEQAEAEEEARIEAERQTKKVLRRQEKEDEKKALLRQKMDLPVFVKQGDEESSGKKKDRGVEQGNHEQAEHEAAWATSNAWRSRENSAVFHEVAQNQGRSRESRGDEVRGFEHRPAQIWLKSKGRRSEQGQKQEREQQRDRNLLAPPSRQHSLVADFEAQGGSHLVRGRGPRGGSQLKGGLDASGNWLNADFIPTQAQHISGGAKYEENMPPELAKKIDSMTSVDSEACSCRNLRPLYFFFASVNLLCAYDFALFFSISLSLGLALLLPSPIPLSTQFPCICQVFKIALSNIVGRVRGIEVATNTPMLCPGRLAQVLRRQGKQQGPRF